jgi:putative ABC transport system permease protein
MSFLNRITTMFGSESLDRDLDDELRSHIEMRTEDNIASGMPPAEARRDALIRFGSPTKTKEETRSARIFTWLESLGRDLRYGLRQLRKNPGFATVAVLTLALGIGANTAIFSIVNGVIFRPLGYPHPERLMHFTTQFPNLGFLHFPVSPPEYLEFQEINKSFSAVGAYTTGEVNLSGTGRPLRVRSASVDRRLLVALGLHAAQGRLFRQKETEVSGPPPAPGQASPLPARVAILSHELWQSAFGSRPMVGEMVEVDGVRREVVGIMPAGADLMDNRTQIWLPLGLNPANRQDRGDHFLYLIGRLKDGETVQSARVELKALIQNWGARLKVQGHVFEPLGEHEAHLLQITPVRDEILGAAGRSIWVLQAAVGLVLLIACVNLANLLLARSETRRREFAVRAALGANRRRLFRQFVTEGVLLSVAGGILGLWLAYLGVQALVRAYPMSLPRTGAIAVDVSVLLFTFAVTMATGLLFGLVPLMQMGVRRLGTALKQGGARGATSGSSRHRVRRGMVVGELALAVMLVIGAGLLLSTVYNLMNVDAGFNRSRLVTFSITLPEANYPRASARAQMYDRLLQRLRSLPGIRMATAMSGLPPNRPLDANDTDIGNYTASPEGPAKNVDYYQFVMSGYFETMGIPIVQGRGFEPRDKASSGGVAVVNEKFVNTFWKGRNPIGQQVQPYSDDQRPWFRVIGVAKDVRQGGVDQPPGTELYLLVEQTADLAVPWNGAPGTMNVVLNTTIPAGALSDTITRVVHEADPNIPVVRLRDMESVFTESISRPRLLAQLIAAFAIVALLLAAIGTYGVLSYRVAERTREIGIRMAMGAEPRNISLLVLREGMVLASVGAACGLVAALGVSRGLTSLLYKVKPADPLTFLLTPVLLVLIAFLACWRPARRAAKVEPMVALRNE